MPRNENANSAAKASGALSCEVALSKQEAEALARADEFADHRADHRERDRDLGAGEDEGQRRRKLNLQENLHRAGAQAVRQFQQFARRGAQARDAYRR